MKKLILFILLIPFAVQAQQGLIKVKQADTSSNGFSTQKSLIPYLTKAQIVALNYGTVTSITPAFGFTTSSPITISGSIKVDSTIFSTKNLLSTYLTKAQVLALGYGTGTVTSIATSMGITGGTITGSGTLKADTSLLQTILNFFPKGDTRYLRTAVTSIATSTGITGGTIITTGTLKADTSILQTVLNFFPKGDTRYAKTTALPTGANPTATAGATAVNGSATTFMRSDGAPKVDSTVFSTKALLSTYLTKAQILALGYGTGTVTSITPAFGFTASSPITTSGSIKVDSSVFATKSLLSTYTTKAQDIAAYVPLGRTLTAGTGILTIGDLSANRTIGVDTSVVQTILNFFPKADTRYVKLTGAVTGVSNADGSLTISPATGAVVGSINLANSNNFSTNQAITEANLTTSITTGFNLANSTASTAGVPVQNSLASLWSSGVWNTTATAANNTAVWKAYVTNTSGSSPITTWTLASNLNGAGDVTRFTVNNNSGAVTGGSYNKLTITPPGTTATLTLVTGSTLQTTGAFTLNLTTTAASTPTFPTGAGTLAYINSPSFTTPTLGAATATTINKVTITAPASAATLTLATGTTLSTLNTFALDGEGQTTLVAGTKAITITGITSSSRAFVTVVTPGTASLTVQYQAVCTTNTLTIQANLAATTINASDTSTINYMVVN